MAAPFGFELPDPYILEVTMPAIRASLPYRDLSSLIKHGSFPSKRNVAPGPADGGGSKG